MYETKQLTTHHDSRGFFREVLRHTDDIFQDAFFAQLSHSMKLEGEYTREFHYHRYQIDWWYVPVGVMRVVLCELSEWGNDSNGDYIELITTGEELIKIPPMTAHGFKVLEGPAHLIYLTSQVYNPEDEERIILDYNWNK